MKIIKVVISTFLFWGLGVNGFCIDVSQNPTVDFGIINYLYNGAGFGQVTISDSGTPSTGGAGYIMNQSGGSAGTVGFSINFLENLLGGRNITLTTKTDSYTTQQSASCGQVTISNIHTTGGANTASKQASTNSPATFPIGATLTLDSFVSSSPCTIQETFSAAMTGSNLWGSKDASLTIRVQIIPNMAVTHDSAALNFGTICRSTTQQQVLTIAPDGGVSGTYVCPTQNTSADSFTVTGNIGQSFNVNLPNTVTISNGSTNLTVSNLTPSCSSNCQLTANTYNLKVGGTLTVPAGTPLGTYQGNYQVSITY
jgi:hypothetical protein